MAEITENYVKNLQDHFDEAFTVRRNKEKAAEKGSDILKMMLTELNPIELADRMELYFTVKRDKYGQREVSRVIGSVRSAIIREIKMLVDSDYDPENITSFLTEIESTRGFGLTQFGKVKYLFKLMFGGKPKV